MNRTPTEPAFRFSSIIESPMRPLEQQRLSPPHKALRIVMFDALLLAHFIGIMLLSHKFLLEMYLLVGWRGEYYSLRVEFECALALLTHLFRRAVQIWVLPRFLLVQRVGDGLFVEGEGERSSNPLLANEFFAHERLIASSAKMLLSIYAFFFFFHLSTSMALVMFVINFTENNPKKVLSRVSRSIIHYLHVITFTSLYRLRAKWFFVFGEASIDLALRDLDFQSAIYARRQRQRAQ